MPDTHPPTLIHYRAPGTTGTACNQHNPQAVEHSDTDPGGVTCFACRKSEAFKQAQLRQGVGVPTPVKLSGVMAEAPDLARLMNDVLKACRNERGMYVIEEVIHHGDYRSVRRVEVYGINAVTVDAVIQSSAYAYGSWLKPDNPDYKEVRNRQLHELVADLKALRTNRGIGWSTFRIITEH